MAASTADEMVVSSSTTTHLSSSVGDDSGGDRDTEDDILYSNRTHHHHLQHNVNTTNIRTNTDIQDGQDIDSTTNEHVHASFACTSSSSSSSVSNSSLITESSVSLLPSPPSNHVLNTNVHGKLVQTPQPLARHLHHLSPSLQPMATSYQVDHSISHLASFYDAAVSQQQLPMFLDPVAPMNEYDSTSSLVTNGTNSANGQSSSAYQQQQQQILRLYHHLESSANAAVAAAASNASVTLPMDPITGLMSSLHTDHWQSVGPTNHMLQPPQQSQQAQHNSSSAVDEVLQNHIHDHYSEFAVLSRPRSGLEEDELLNHHRQPLHNHHHHSHLNGHHHQQHQQHEQQEHTQSQSLQQQALSMHHHHQYLMPVSVPHDSALDHPSATNHLQHQKSVESPENDGSSSVLDHSIAEQESAIVISDLPVESRARASLPSNYLVIEVMDVNDDFALEDDTCGSSLSYGVFARKTIPERTQFGPVEGVVHEFSSDKLPLFNHNQNILVYVSDTLILDQSDENNSNWTRFVRTAKNYDEQNLILVTKECHSVNSHGNHSHDLNASSSTTKFYFMTTRCINAREELKVWYSKEYAERFNLNLLDELTNDTTAHGTSASHDLDVNDIEVSRQIRQIQRSLSSNDSDSVIHMVHHSIAHSQQQQSSTGPQHGANSVVIVNHPHHSPNSLPPDLHSLTPVGAFDSIDQSVDHGHHVTIDTVPIDISLHLGIQHASPNGTSSASIANGALNVETSTCKLNVTTGNGPEMLSPLDLTPPASSSSDQRSNILNTSNGSGTSDISNGNVCVPTASGHKLRNKIAKSQQQQQAAAQLANGSNGKNTSNGNFIDSYINETNDMDPSSSSSHITDGKMNEDTIASSTINCNDANHTSSTSTTSSSNSHTCDACGKSFPRFYSLKRHQIMHSGEKKFKCPICFMNFSHVYNRNRHVKRHHQRVNNDTGSHSGTSECVPSQNAEVSGETNSEQANDDTMHCNQLVFVNAQESDKKSPDTSTASPEVSQENVKENPIATTQKLYRCSQCYKSFSSDERLAKHAIVHTGDDQSKPLQCNICFKRFLNNSALSCHLKVHSTPRDQPRKYDCVFCKEVFDDTTSRKEHIQSHLDPMTNQFTCPNCNKKFDEFAAVRKHIRAFHSDKKYPCSICEKIFPRPDKLKLHMLRHSDHREFLCSTCGKQFKRKDKLKEHIQRMHAPDREARLAAKAAARVAAAAAAAAANCSTTAESSNCANSNSSTSTSASIQTLQSNGQVNHENASGITFNSQLNRKFIPKVSPNDYHQFVYKCHTCLLGFKRRGMLVNHLAKRHPETPPDAVPELNLPILKTTRDYYCQYCDKIYKSSSKRKAHILKNHPGKSLPLSNRHKGGLPSIPGIPNPTYSATVGSITTHPHYCSWCHKQYASKAKLLQHQRKKHPERANCRSLSENSKDDHLVQSNTNDQTNDDSLTVDEICLVNDTHLSLHQSDVTTHNGAISLNLINNQMDHTQHTIELTNETSGQNATCHTDIQLINSHHGPSSTGSSACTSVDSPISNCQLMANSSSNVPDNGNSVSTRSMNNHGNSSDDGHNVVLTTQTTSDNNNNSNNNNNNSNNHNLMAILGSFGINSLNGFISNATHDATTESELQELLQSNPASLLLTQAMNELHQQQSNHPNQQSEHVNLNGLMKSISDHPIQSNNNDNNSLSNEPSGQNGQSHGQITINSPNDLSWT